MLRACFTPCTRPVASSSTAAASSLHTSAVLQSFRKRKSRVKEQVNVAKRQERERAANSDHPHVVLGTRPSNAGRWENCDLAKILITEQDILTTPIVSLKSVIEEGVEAERPTFYNYGVGEKDREMLLEALPALTVEGQSMRTQYDPKRSMQMWNAALHENEERKAALLARLVDLRNANARGIAYENRRRCIAEFSEPGNPNDTGRPEVQAALLTMKIRNIWEHMNRSRKDTASRRSLRILIHQRAKILKYLKRLDLDRYEKVLERLGLELESVEGELLV